MCYAILLFIDSQLEVALQFNKLLVKLKSNGAGILVILDDHKIFLDLRFLQDHQPPPSLF